VTKQISCDNLVAGNYSLVKNSGPPQTFSLDFGQQQALQTLTALTPGDVVVLNYTGPSSPARPLTTLHVNTLRADVALQPSNGFTNMLLQLSTTCQVGEWFYGSDSGQVCTTGGHPAPPDFGSSFIASPPNGTVGLLDEFSGNATTVTIGQVTSTGPLNGESIYDAYTAYASANVGGCCAPDTTDPVALQVAPIAHTPACPDASCTAFTGNANSASGVTVSGLAPGQYQAAWTLTNPHGDTSSLMTTFNVQAGGTNGTNGAPGTNGAAGANGAPGTNGAAGANGTPGANGAPGPAGPQGPAGQVELVTCKSVTTGTGKKKKTVQRCTTKLTSSPVKFTTTGAATSAVLSRGGVIYATGTATRSGNRTRLLLSPRRQVGRGHYTLTLTRHHKHQHETVTIN
jgi:hypothetical protein